MKRTKSQSIILFFAVISTCILTNRLNAAAILYEFGGTIDFFTANDGLENPFQGVQTFSGTFTYDDNVLASWDDGDQAGYHETIGNFEMNFGGFQMSGGNETSYIRVGNDTHGVWDFINISTPLLTSPSLDYLFKDITGQFHLQSSINTWDSVDLPTSLSLLDQLSDSRFWIYGYYDTVDFQASAVGGDVQYLKAISVPEPSTIYLFGSIICIFLIKRQTRKNY